MVVLTYLSSEVLNIYAFIGNVNVQKFTQRAKNYRIPKRKVLYVYEKMARQKNMDRTCYGSFLIDQTQSHKDKDTHNSPKVSRTQMRSYSTA